MMARGFEQRQGNGGDDLIIGLDARYLAQGEVFDAEAKAQAEAIWATYEAAIANGETADIPEVDRNSGVAQQEQRMRLDGGEGNDWVFAFGGERAITVGGAGNDFIINTSEKGQLWGDGIDGALEPTNSGGRDTFLYSRGSFIMDAENHDILSFLGIPLTGGTNFFVANTDIVYDFLLPFIHYGLTKDGDLLVSFGKKLDRDASAEELLESSMVVRNFDFGGFRAGETENISLTSLGLQNRGDLGMIFRIYNGPDAVPFRLFGALFGHIKIWADQALFGANDNECELRRVA